MAPARRPCLTILLNEAPADDAMAALLWTAVPVKHCTPEMRDFRAQSEPLRVSDSAASSHEGLPRSDNAGHPTIQTGRLEA